MKRFSDSSEFTERFPPCTLAISCLRYRGKTQTLLAADLTSKKGRNRVSLTFSDIGSPLLATQSSNRPPVVVAPILIGFVRSPCVTANQVRKKLRYARVVAADVQIEFEIGVDIQIRIHWADFLDNIFQNGAQRRFGQNVQPQSFAETGPCEIQYVVDEIAHANGARLHENKNVAASRTHPCRPT